MGKAASKKNIERASQALEISPGAIGPRLGVLVYRCKVPASAVAVLLRTSVPTLYRWFYGVNDVAPEFRKRVIRVGKLLEAGFAAGQLPAVGDIDTRIQILTDLVRADLAKRQS